MTKTRALMSSLVLLSLGAGVCAAKAPAPTPTFTISANAYTMPSRGNGTIAYTLTSVNGFEGIVQVGCTNPNPPAGVREPKCGNYGDVPRSGDYLPANGTVTGYVGIDAVEPLPVHQVSQLKLRENGRAARWALAGVLMLGLGVRRRKARQFLSLLIVAGVLMGVTACAGPETLTPGVYVYTLTAESVGQETPSLVVSTTVNVTVPRGIVIQKAPTAVPAAR